MIQTIIKNLFASLLFLMVSTLCAQERVIKNELVTLTNGNLSLGILSNGGGRVVSLKLNGNKSVIYSDSLLWYSDFLMTDNKYSEPKFIDLSGHINWIGPQSDWWTQQEIFPELKERESVWPPDPYLTYGDYKIKDQSDSSIILESPESIYSGVQIKKQYKINSDNTVNVVAEMKNIRTEKVEWDLWFNTRMNGYDIVYVPISDTNEIRIEYRTGQKQGRMPYQIKGGFFSFTPEPPENSMFENVAKAFIYPHRNRIYAFTHDELFVIEFERYEKNLTHPEQGMIEIYNSIKQNGAALLELEYHSPYVKLEPREMINSSEKWYIVKYNDSSDFSSHKKAIEKFESSR